MDANYETLRNRQENLQKSVDLVRGISAMYRELKANQPSVPFPLEEHTEALATALSIFQTDAAALTAALEDVDEDLDQ